jgi:hypothetical protein
MGSDDDAAWSPPVASGDTSSTSDSDKSDSEREGGLAAMVDDRGDSESCDEGVLVVGVGRCRPGSERVCDMAILLIIQPNFQALRYGNRSWM